MINEKYDACNTRLENFVNRGRSIEHRALGKDTPKQFNLSYIILFANFGAILLLGIMYQLVNVNREIALAQWRVIFSPDLGIFLMFSICMTFGSALLIPFDWITNKYKNRNRNFNSSGCTCLQCGKLFAGIGNPMLCPNCDEDFQLAENHKLNHRTLDALFEIINVKADEHEKDVRRRAENLRELINTDPEHAESYKLMLRDLERWLEQ